MSSTNTSIELQQRDLAILEGLFEHRLMTLRHIAAIHFGGRWEAAKKRMRRLRVTGYVSVRQHSQRSPAIYSLTQQAFDTLQRNGVIDLKYHWREAEKRLSVSATNLSHELVVIDCIAALSSGMRVRGIKLNAEFLTRPQHFEFKTFSPFRGETVVLKPDAFVRLVGSDTVNAAATHKFFLEVDRSTEPTHTLVHKLLCYREHARRIKPPTVSHFGKRAPHPHFPFRVLIICKSKQRCINLTARLQSLKPPIMTLACIATLADFIDNPTFMIDQRKSGDN